MHCRPEAKQTEKDESGDDDDEPMIGPPLPLPVTDSPNQEGSDEESEDEEDVSPEMLWSE